MVGMSELLVLIPIALLSLAVPVVVITLLVMIYRKLNRIEQRLGAQG
jgi:hypothetical protein